MLPQNTFVEALSSLKLTQALVQPAKVVGGRHSDATIVVFILDGFLLAPVQGLLVEWLQQRWDMSMWAAGNVPRLRLVWVWDQD